MVEGLSTKIPGMEWRRKKGVDQSVKGGASADKGDTDKRDDGVGQKEGAKHGRGGSGKKTKGSKGKVVLTEEVDVNNVIGPHRTEATLGRVDSIGKAQVGGKRRVANRKRNVGSRPVAISPILARTSATRVHQVVFDQGFPRGPLNFEPDFSFKAQRPNTPVDTQAPGLDNNHGREASVSKPEATVTHPPRPPDASPLGESDDLNRRQLDGVENWYETQAETMGESEEEVEGTLRRESSLLSALSS